MSRGSTQSAPAAVTPSVIPEHELLSPIASGSYGEVWLARSALGALRAVKIVRRSTFDHDRPFEREFAGMKAFEPISRGHENLIDLLQVGRNDTDGYFYYVMELADDIGPGPPGQGADSRNDAQDLTQGAPSPTTHSYAARTLKAELQRRGRMAPGECIELGLAVCGALAYLHKQGLVHRDVKPSNILFVGGVPKLADVGLVTNFGETRSYVGTEGFIPPEGPGKPQADLYSLGIVLYEMSTGKTHQDFPEPLADLAAQPDHARWLEFNSIIHKACRAEVRERFQNAEEMRDELALLGGGQSVKRKRAVERCFAVAKKAGLAAATVAIVAVLLFYASIGLLRRNIASQAEYNSIAVLPFTLQPPNQADQFLSESLPDELIQTLGRIRGVKVAARGSSSKFKDGKEEPQSIGRQLKVRTLLKGVITKSGDQLNVEAILINASEGSRLWSKTYDGRLTDLPVIGKGIAREVAATLKVPLSDEQGLRLVRPPTENPKAYPLYLEGSYLLYRWSGAGAEIDSAIELLQKAVALDSKSAAIHARLAQACAQKAFGADPQARWQAQAAVEIAAALALDPDSAEAFLARGKVLWSPGNGFQHALAVKDFHRALALAPNLADAYHGLAVVYVHVGLFEKAREASRQALALDPLNSGAQFREGVAYLYEGRYKEALDVFKAMGPSVQPALVAMQTATTLFYLGRPDDAKDCVEKLLPEKRTDPLLHSTLALLYAAQDETEKAKEEIRLAAEEEKEYGGHYHHVSYNIASAYALMKDNPPALTWLRKAADDGYPCYPRFAKDPNLDNLRRDLQFKSFMDDQRQQFERFQKTL